MKDITLKELLECEFTINENGKMVGEIPLERINEIADILTNQQQENKHLNLQLDQALKDYEKLLIKINKAIEYIKNDYDEENYNFVPKKRLLAILGDEE